LRCPPPTQQYYHAYLRRVRCVAAGEQAVAGASKLPLLGGLHFVRPIFMFQFDF